MRRLGSAGYALAAHHIVTLWLDDKVMAPQHNHQSELRAVQDTLGRFAPPIDDGKLDLGRFAPPIDDDDKLDEAHALLSAAQLLVEAADALLTALTNHEGELTSRVDFRELHEICDWEAAP